MAQARRQEVLPGMERYDLSHREVADWVPRPMPADGTELTPEDELWPDRAEDMPDVPRVINVLGDPSALGERCISVVGARRTTPYGEAVAELVGRVAAECGLTVVSGGALGVDSIAARAALAAGGRTVVIPGGGADVVYPARSRDVFAMARAGQGCVASLMPWGFDPLPWTFPKRNVLIAALSPVTVVCEAGMPSGTIITAEAALEMGRTLYAAPGSVFSQTSRGANHLIANGAVPIIDEASLEQAIALDYRMDRAPSLREAPDRGRLLSALVANPLRPDELSARLDLNTANLMALLTEYEIRGLVCRLPDGRYSPTKRAFFLRDNALIPECDRVPVPDETAYETDGTC